MSLLDLELVDWQTSFSREIREREREIVQEEGKEKYAGRLRRAEVQDDLLTAGSRLWEEIKRQGLKAARKTDDPRAYLGAMNEGRKIVLEAVRRGGGVPGASLIGQTAIKEAETRLNQLLVRELNEDIAASDLFLSLKNQYAAVLGDPANIDPTMAGEGPHGFVLTSFRDFPGFLTKAREIARSTRSQSATSLKGLLAGEGQSEEALRAALLDGLELPKALALVLEDPLSVQDVDIGRVAQRVEGQREIRGEETAFAAADWVVDEIASKKGPAGKIVEENRDEFRRLGRLRYSYLQLAAQSHSIANQLWQQSQAQTQVTAPSGPPRGGLFAGSPAESTAPPREATLLVEGQTYASFLDASKAVTQELDHVWKILDAAHKKAPKLPGADPFYMPMRPREATMMRGYVGSAVRALEEFTRGLRGAPGFRNVFTPERELEIQGGLGAAFPAVEEPDKRIANTFGIIPGNAQTFIEDLTKLGALGPGFALVRGFVAKPLATKLFGTVAEGTIKQVAERAVVGGITGAGGMALSPEEMTGKERGQAAAAGGLLGAVIEPVAGKVADRGRRFVKKAEFEELSNTPLIASLDRRRAISFGDKPVSPARPIVVEHTSNRPTLEKFLAEGVDATQPSPGGGLGRLTTEPGAPQPTMTRIREPGLYVAPANELASSESAVIIRPARDFKLTPESTGLGYKTGVRGLFGANDARLVQKIESSDVAGLKLYNPDAKRWEFVPNPRSPYADQIRVSREGRLSIEAVRPKRVLPAATRDPAAAASKELGRDVVTVTSKDAIASSISKKGVGNAARPEGGQLHAIHVTDDPSPVLQALRSGRDITKTREAGKFGDLGPGLYASNAPQLWMGRSRQKWGFLQQLGKKKNAMLDALEADIEGQRVTRYISESEAEYAKRIIQDVRAGRQDIELLTDLASQPYNIKFWDQSWLNKLGLKASPDPHQVPMVLEGRFAKITGGLTDAEARRLQKLGYDGAINSGGMADTPQLVVWNNDAVVRFGDYVSPKAPPKIRQEVVRALPSEATSGQVAERVGGEPGFLVPKHLEQALARERTAESSLAAIRATPSTVSDITPTASPETITKLDNAAKDARFFLPEQRRAFKIARQAQVAEARKVGQKFRGLGLYSEKVRAMKSAGDFKRPDLESFRDKFTRQEMLDLQQTIEKNPRLLEYEKLRAQKALGVDPNMRGPGGQELYGLLSSEGAQIPTNAEIELLGRVFGRDFARTLSKKRGIKKWDRVAEAFGLTRALMATLDLSATLRQAVFVAPRHPVLVSRAFVDQLRQFKSESNFRASMERVARDPLYERARTAKLALTGVEEASATIAEEQFIGAHLIEQYATKEGVPKVLRVGPRAVRASNRAHTGFLTRLRMDLFRDFIHKAEQAGHPAVGTKEFDRAAARFINAATGRGDMLPAGKVMSSVLFSPRLLSSRLELINPWTYLTLYRQDPFLGRKALEQAFSFVALQGSILAAFDLYSKTPEGSQAGVYIEKDMRSPDWGKVRIRDTRIDVTGGFAQYPRLLTQIIHGVAGQPAIKSSTTGEIKTLGQSFGDRTIEDVFLDALKNKAAPVPGFALKMMRQGVYGEPLEIPKEVRELFVPLIIQDTIDIAKKDPSLLPLVIPMILGVGAQTYPIDKPARELLDLATKYRIGVRQPRTQLVRNRAVPLETIEALTTAQDIENIRKKLAESKKMLDPEDAAELQEQLGVLAQDIINAMNQDPDLKAEFERRRQQFFELETQAAEEVESRERIGKGDAVSESMKKVIRELPK